MRSLQLVPVILLLFACNLSAQPEVQWTSTIGTENDDYCFSVARAGNGYILAGKTVAGDQDYYLVKTDGSGNLQWDRTYGGDGHEWCYSVCHSTDGGYLLGGYVEYLVEGGHDMWLVKTDQSGEVEWEHTYGGDSHDYCYVVIQTSDGGYLLGGRTDSFSDHNQLYAVKIDADGNVDWTYTSNVGSWCNTATQTQDGGYILGGSGVLGVCLIRIDSEGTHQWYRTWNGSVYEDANSIIETPQGEFVLAGNKGVNNPNMYVIKTEADGDTLWARSYGGDGEEKCRTILQTFGGNYLLAGYSDSFDQPDGGMYLVKIDPDGSEIWSQTYPTQSTTDCWSAMQLADGSLVLGGTNYGDPVSNFYLMKTNSDGLPVGEGDFAESPTVYLLHPAWPNPFNPSTTLGLDLADKAEIEVRVFDLLGKQVSVLASGELGAGHHHLRFNAEGLPSGTYLVRAGIAGGMLETQKVVLIR